MGYCPNCGAGSFINKDHCQKCGFKEPSLRELGAAKLVFCTACGCNYLDYLLDGCVLHGRQFLEDSKL